MSLIEDYEFELLGVPELPEMTGNLGIRWFHLPIVDLDIPDGRFVEEWEVAGKDLRQLLEDGGKIVLHCRGGLGRTGMIAARLLVEFGTPVRQLPRSGEPVPVPYRQANRRSMCGDAEKISRPEWFFYLHH